MLQKPYRKPLEISLVPLINVVFLLLIFFLVVGTITPIIDTSKVTVPVAETGQTIVSPSLIVAVRRDGTLLVNNQQLPYTALHDTLATVLKDHPDQEILVRADAGLEAEKLTQLIVRIQCAGGKNLSISSRSPETL